ncbi:unnamed protein product [Penicillium roqueforti FM164]|uniref:Genomic scaffold, ProqFM164S02 n=1 Tax=Penicillium roqueforti (strain FM164) TaxID=1365484 RepID=W6Q776_PENRF|nr:unnamed protein product [Penicillium roqueforti FM164]
MGLRILGRRLVFKSAMLESGLEVLAICAKSFAIMAEK